MDDPFVPEIPMKSIHRKLINDLISCVISPDHWEIDPIEREHEKEVLIKDFREIFPEIPHRQVMDWINEIRI